MQLECIDGITLRDLASANLDSLNRTPGVHVTDIIYTGIMPTVDPGRYGPTAKKKFPEADAENYQEAGFIWEEMLGAVFARRAVDRPAQHGEMRWRPGELVSPQGIIGSPDALVLGLTDFPDIEPERYIVEEYKMTWKGANSFDLYDKRYMPWLMQIKSYLVLAQARECRLYVCHINGGYEGYIPEVKVHRLRFSGADLADHWVMMLNTCKKLGWPLLEPTR